MSDQEYAKKLVEEADLEPFLPEYRLVTGLALHLIDCRERLDFVCRRSDGTELGIELCKVTVDPESRFCRRILDRQEYMEPTDTVMLLQELVYRKDAKRSSNGWALPNRTLLLLQLMELPVEELAPLLEEQILDELARTGFLEIWIADYTIREAYGTVQVFGIKPERWRGVHDHSMTGSKPYG